MENTVPLAGIEPIFLAFWASVLRITPTRLPDVNIASIATVLCIHLRLYLRGQLDRQRIHLYTHGIYRLYIMVGKEGKISKVG